MEGVDHDDFSENAEPPLYATHLTDLLGRNEASIKLHFTFLRFLLLMMVCLHRIPSSSFG